MGTVLIINGSGGDGVGRVARVTTGYTAAQNDNLLLVDASGGDAPVVLPDPAGHGPITSQEIVLHRVDTSANNVVVTPPGGCTVGGAASLTVYPGERYVLRADGLLDWKIENVYRPGGI